MNTTKKIQVYLAFFCLALASVSFRSVHAMEIAITNITVSEVTETSAVITWTSSVGGDSQIRYSANSADFAYASMRIVEPFQSDRIYHRASLQGLSGNTVYYFEVLTANPDIGSSFPSQSKFMTLIPENMKPDLTITDIYFSPQTPTYGEQFIGEAIVKVINHGGGATNGPKGIPVIIIIADAQTGVTSDWQNAGFYYIDNMAAGASSEARFPVKYTTFNYDVLRIKAWVDSNAMSADKSDNLYINESNEGNNFFQKDIPLNETAGNLLSLELDKVALNATEIESGFILTHLVYNASDVSSSNSGIPQPLESINQVYQSKNVRTDRQSITASLRTHKSIADARRHFAVLNTQHYRQVLPLSAANKETFGDEIFCHTSPDYTERNRKEGQPDIYYFICGFRYGNIFIDLQAEITNNNYTIPLWNLREYFDNIINYDPTRVPPVPGTLCTDHASGMLTVCSAQVAPPAKPSQSVPKAVPVGTVESAKIEPLILKLERTISELEQRVVELEKKLVEAIDKKLTNRVKGRILLQVEESGEAWYVDPASGNKLYMKDGIAAYDIMRALGLGISNVNLDKIPIGIQEKLFNLQDADADGIPDNVEVAIGTDLHNSDSDGDGFTDKEELLKGYRPNSPGKYISDSRLVDKLKGRILLQVEAHGEAWYMNPVDGKRYYLGDPATAYNVMRFLSLGIKNSDLRKIQVGEFEEK